MLKKISNIPHLILVDSLSSGIGDIGSNMVAFDRQIDEYRSLLIGSADARRVSQHPLGKYRSRVTAQVNSYSKSTDSGIDPASCTFPINRIAFVPIRKRGPFQLTG